MGRFFSNFDYDKSVKFLPDKKIIKFGYQCKDLLCMHEYEGVLLKFENNGHPDYTCHIGYGVYHVLRKESTHNSFEIFDDIDSELYWNYQNDSDNESDWDWISSSLRLSSNRWTISSASYQSP